MTRPLRADTGGRLSLRALAIASVASATAAIVTSRLWAPGAALAAALTPVIVAIVSELLSRPAEHVSRVRAYRRRASAGGMEPPVDERPDDQNGARTATGRATRIYGRRRFRLKVALVTAAIAFVVAVAAVTLPELLFGKAVATDRQTTLFGGAPPQQQGPQPTETAPGTTPTAPAEQPPSPTTPTTPRTTPPSERQPRPSEAPPRGQTTSTP
jgi:MFS family permease